MKYSKFSNLDILMAKYRLSLDDLSKIIGKSYRQTSLKVRGKAGITIDDAKRIVEFFRSKGEEVSTDFIFFVESFSNEKGTA